RAAQRRRRHEARLRRGRLGRGDRAHPGQARDGGRHPCAVECGTHGLSLHAARRDDEGYDTGRMTGLRGALSTETSKAVYVRRLFHTIADRYDLITRLLSYGQDRRWKARLVALAPPEGGRALDLASGTGDIGFALAARGWRVAALDLTHRMLQLARGKPSAAAALGFVTADMMALPFPDETFDLVT